jgi:hypothetical protein
MTEGVENTLVMVVFITKDYMEKVNGEDERVNCREFTFGVEVMGPQNMVPVIMEPRTVRINKSWTGELGAALRSKLYADMCSDDGVEFASKLEELVG